MSNCYYCGIQMQLHEMVKTVGYWGGSPFECHKSCKDQGIKDDAYQCQLIDADCNDCKHFKRGEVVKRWLSCIENGKPSKRLVNMGIIDGHCLKLDKPTQAQPNKCSMYPCFEHRRSP